jgi:alpha-L-rhamnosidase
MKRKWKAKWIGRKDILIDWRGKVLPAPFFRKVFEYREKIKDAKVYICGIGYYELYINGKKVSDNVLNPVVSCYDKRVRYVVHDVKNYIIKGKNVIGVILGNGLYNSNTPEVWHFDKATWRDYPKLLFELEINGKVTVFSDKSWKVKNGPIIFDGLRNGEFYDGRMELNGWLNFDFDDSNWENVNVVPPPGGILEEQLMPPCKVMETLHPVKKWALPNGDIVFDFGQNFAGWVRIVCSGEKGREVIIKYAERIKEDGDISQEKISCCILGGEFQTDKYILKGDKEETWEPRFTYHGFRYVKIKKDINIELKKVEGRVVYTSFEKIGNFVSSNEILNKLQHCTEWSYKSNFVGIPTDCPHREKNGWTGDAHLACETGLYNFNSSKAYQTWIDNFIDVQRPSGQIPGIVPTSGWGYNWGNGPAWDSAFLLIPWYIYLYTGDKTAIEKNYEGMKKYVDYLTYMADNNIIHFGLGDWLSVDLKTAPSISLISTSYYYVDCILLSKFAEIVGKKRDKIKYKKLAEKIKYSFNKTFYKGDGIYENGGQTALGCALYQGLVENYEKEKVVLKLVESIKLNNFKVNFGFLGAKFVPNALSENGYVDIAYKLITQTEYPGWGYWVKNGATTLWETWDGRASLNHIALGDISAWMYKYLGGILPDPEKPGFKHIIIKPNPVCDLKWVICEHICKFGKILSKWERSEEKFVLEVEIPKNTTATIILPDLTTRNVKDGFYKFICQFKNQQK